MTHARFFAAFAAVADVSVGFVSVIHPHAVRRWHMMCAVIPAPCLNRYVCTIFLDADDDDDDDGDDDDDCDPIHCCIMMISV